MKVAIDARWIFREISGIGAYTRELITHLAREPGPHDYLLLFHEADLREREMAATGCDGHARFTSVLLPDGVFSPAGQFRTPRALRRHGVEVYHATNYMIPLPAFPRNRRGAIACVVTVHDVIPLKFPHFAPRARKNRVFALYRALMREVGRRADIIVTDSRASRDDVLEHMRIPTSRHDRVRTVYCGVAEQFRPPTAPRNPDERARRILYVGRADPYKNLEGLVRAFAQARRDGLCDARLVIAGARDARYPEAEDRARTEGVLEHVTWTGYLDDDGLVRAYQEADVLVLPSRYEGFGLPVAEAMACGTPVICSTCGSLPEVAGDAARLHDPDDIGGMAQSIRDVLDTPAVARDLRTRGLAQVACFRWDRVAATMRDIYSEAAGA